MTEPVPGQSTAEAEVQAEARNTSSGPPAVPPKTPFKFLEYYEVSDEDRFAGREREVVELADAVIGPRAFVLYGKSGLGKTSLLLAGLFPELERRHWTPVHLRTLKHPLRDVYQELATLWPSSSSGEKRTLDTRAQSNFDEDALIELLLDLSAEHSVLLVLDQFEEFFIRFRDQRDVYQSFVSTIGRIVRDRRLKVHVLFSLREEYLADMDDFRSSLPSLFEAEYRLRPMTAYRVRKAITRPLEVAGMDFDPRLVAKLVDQLAKSRFDSVELQILCQEVFEHACARDQKGLRLTLDDLRSAGDVDAIFHRYLEDTIRALPKKEHLRTRVVLHALTTSEQTKQALRIVDFANTLFRLEEEEIQAILDVLRKHRIVRRDLRGEEEWYELTHERLVPIIEKWLRIDRRFNELTAARDLIATACRGGVWRQATQNLLSEGYLTDVVGPFRRRLVLGADEVEFVLWSAIYHRHQDVAFWSKRYGPKKSRALVLEHLSTADDMLRRGAAFSAGRILVGDTEAANALLDLSLNDPSIEVQREAGLALGKVAAKSATSPLRDALSNRKTRKQALETLADLSASDADLRDMPVIYRWWARRIARKRVLKENRQIIRDAAGTGTIGGLLGALGWTCTVVLVYGLFVSYYFSAVEGEKWWLVLLAIFGIVLVPSMVFGSMFGYACSRSLAVQLYLRGRVTWAGAVWRNWVFRFVPILWVAGWTLVGTVAVFENEGGFPVAPDQVLTVTAVAMLPLGYWLLMAPLLAPIERAARGAKTLKQVLGVALLGGAGLSIVAPTLLAKWGLAALATAGPKDDAAEAFTIVSLLAIPISSALVAAIAAALGRTWLSHRREFGESKVVRVAGRQRTLYRAALLAAFALCFALVLGELGLGVVPLQPSSGTLDPNGSALVLKHTFDEDRELPEAQYLSFVAPGAKPSVVEIERRSKPFLRDSGGMALFPFYYSLRLGGDRVGDSELHLLSSGRHLLAISGTKRGTAVVSIKHRGFVASDDLTPSSSPYAWLTWTRSDGDSPDPLEELNDRRTVHYDGHLDGRFEGNGKSSNTVFVVFAESVIVDKDLGSASLQIQCQADDTKALGSIRTRYFDGASETIPARMVRPSHSCLVREKNGARSWSLESKLALVSFSKHVPDRFSTLVRLTDDLSSFDFDSADLSFWNLENFDLARVDLTKANLTSAILTGADLNGAVLTSAVLADADLGGANLERADLGEANLRDAKLSNAKASGASFIRADLTSTNLSKLQASKDASFWGANLLNADLSGAQLGNADFSGANLEGANLTGAILENATGLTREQLDSACGQDSIVAWAGTRGSAGVVEGETGRVTVNLRPCPQESSLPEPQPLTNAASTIRPRCAEAPTVDLQEGLEAATEPGSDVWIALRDRCREMRPQPALHKDDQGALVWQESVGKVTGTCRCQPVGSFRIAPITQVP